MTTPPLNRAAVPAFLQARNLYWVALAAHQLVQEKDRASKQAVLDTHVFVSAKHRGYKTERITTPDHDYLMLEDDFTRYCKLVHVERLKRGLVLPYEKYEFAKDKPWNLCADVETRPLLRQAEDHFIETANTLKDPPFFDADGLRHLKTLLDARERFIDLACRLDLGDHPSAKTVLASIGLPA